MAERRTKPGAESVDDVLGAVTDTRRADEAREVVEQIRQVTGAEPVVWGGSMIGFGRRPYTTADASGEWFALGVAARKTALTLYGLTYYGSNADLLERLGPHTTGKGCLYLKRLDAVDRDVLAELVRRSWETNHVPG